MGIERGKHPLKKKIASGAVIFALGAGAGAAGYHNKEVINFGVDAAISQIYNPQTKIEFTQEDPTLVKDKIFIDTYNGIDEHFRTRAGQLLTDENGWNPATVWPYGRVLDATYTATLLPYIGDGYKEKNQELLSGLDKYWNTEPGGNYKPGYDAGIFWFGHHERYIDDNLWIGKIFIREYGRSKNAEHLAKAMQIFDLTIGEWDEKGGGGIFWKQQLPGEKEKQKAIVSNGNAVILGVNLFEVTKEPKYLEWSEKIYDWTKTNLFDDSTGIYHDNITEGRIDKTKYTYCQGVMAGAMTKLNEVKPDKYPLEDAVKFANRAMDYYDKNGYGREVAFDSIYFQNFLYLAGRHDSPVFTGRVRDSLSKASSGLQTEYFELIDQSGAAQLRALERLPEESYKFLL